MRACLLGSAVAAACVADGAEQAPLRVSDPRISDAQGGVWSPLNSPRRPVVELALSTIPGDLAGRVAWVRGDADPGLLEDLADPPLRDATRERLLPFALHTTQWGMRLVLDQPLPPGAQSAIVVWSGVEPERPWWQLVLHASSDPAAGAALSASFPANGSQHVPQTIRSILLQWDGYVTGLAAAGARLEGPEDDSREIRINALECTSMGLSPGTCARLELDAPLAIGEHTLNLEGDLSTLSGERMPPISIHFRVSPGAPYPTLTAPACWPDERTTQVACVSRHRESFVIRTRAAAPALVRLQAGPHERVRIAEAGDTLQLSVAARAARSLRVHADDLAGNEHSQSLQAWLSPTSPKVRFSEVAAHPLGSGASREYVQVVNWGAEPISLEGWQLASDPSKRGVQLPQPFQLAAGASALLVGEAFERAAWRDLPPGVPSLRLSGPLRLPDAGGMVVLRDAAGRRVDTVNLPATAQGRCSRVSARSVARAGPCSFEEVPPP